MKFAVSLVFPRFTTMNFAHLKSRMLFECEEQRGNDDRKYMDLSTLTRYTEVIKFTEKKKSSTFFSRQDHDNIDHCSN